MVEERDDAAASGASPWMSASHCLTHAARLLRRHFGVTLEQQESGIGGFASAGRHLCLPEFPKPVQTALHRAIVVAALVFQGKDFAKGPGKFRRIRSLPCHRRYGPSGLPCVTATPRALGPR